MSTARVDLELAGRRASFVPVGHGPVLVCIPGGPGLPGAHMGGLGGLDQERALVRPDWRGAGESDPPPEGSHRIADYVSDLELLRAHLDLEQMDLLGHSFGALVALTYAAVHPERVARLVIDGVPDWRDKERIAALDLPPHFTRWDERTRSFADLLTASWYWAAIEWFVEHEWAGFDPCPSMSLVRAPTLVVTGEHDVTFGAECAAQLASRCTSAEVGVIPGAGHFTWVEEPDSYRQLVGDFLRANPR